MMSGSGAFVPLCRSNVKVFEVVTNNRPSSSSSNGDHPMFKSNQQPKLTSTATGLGNRNRNNSKVLRMTSKKSPDDVDSNGRNNKSFDGIMFPPGLIFVAAVVWPVAQDPLILVAVVTAMVAAYNLFLLQRDD